MPYFFAQSYIARLIHAIGNQFLEEIAVADIGEKIRQSIAYHEVFRLHIGSYSFSFSDTTVATWIAMVLIIGFVVWIGRPRRQIPVGRQIISEGIVDLFISLCRHQGMSEKQAGIVAPFVGSMAVFICFTNLTSVFRIIPPARDPVFPITLALLTIIYVLITGIRLVGLKGFWGSLAYPKAALVPFRILDYLIKPISLSLRLFGNVFGAYILMEFIFIILPAILPGILGLWFDIADGILQAGVFSYLTLVYIGEIVEGAKHYEEKKMEKANSGLKQVGKMQSLPD
jgi:F-type H+-transporting ATPase subunit a